MVLYPQNESDRLLIYITLYISECLKKLVKCTNKPAALNEMYNLAISKWDIPGDPGFILNNVYAKPANPQDAGNLIELANFYPGISLHYFLALTIMQCICDLQNSFGCICNK